MGLFDLQYSTMDSLVLEVSFGMTKRTSITLDRSESELDAPVYASEFVCEGEVMTADF